MDTTDPLVSDGGALMPRQCPFCGWFGVRARRGAVIAFRVFPLLMLPRSVSVPMCLHCGRHFLDSSKEVALTPTLTACYEARLRVMARTALRTLQRRGTPLRQLELTLGLSQGYLSRLSMGAGTPSPALVALLALIADDPTRLAQIHRLWADQKGFA